MLLVHTATELTLRYLRKQEAPLAGDLLFSAKTKREKQKERRKENVFPHSGVISATAAGWRTQVVERSTVPPANLQIRSRRNVSPDPVKSDC